MISLKRIISFFFAAAATGFCLSCAAQPARTEPAPVPGPESLPVPGLGTGSELREKPTAALTLDRIQAGGIHQVTLFFLLEAQNPRTSAARLGLQDWEAVVNGVSSGGSAVLGLEGTAPRVGAGDSRQIPLELTLDLRDLPPDPGDSDEYQAHLALNVGFFFDNQETDEVALTARAVFPRVREPDFTITAIAIKKAELINTRFLVKLRVDNPNVFPVELSAFSYELYGGDRFWAEGEETGALLIPARGFAETELSLVMNFINMRRNVLDQIIAMRQVNYRFAGEAMIRTDNEFLPHFPVDFDRSGYSAVVD
jgi:LEA14-like dessication related protein